MGYTIRLNVTELQTLWNLGMPAERIAERMGVSVAVIERRAKKLNLNPNRKILHRRDRRKTETRDCLRCRRPFQSEGIWNRMCPSCKQQAAHDSYAIA